MNFKFANIRQAQAMAAIAVMAVSFAARAEIVVGVGVPTSGIKAELGGLIVDTAKAEVATLNRDRGAVAETIRLEIADDDCTADGGAAVGAKFASLGARLVIGHPCSNAAITAARVYAAHAIPFVAIGARHPDVTGKRAGPGIFRIGGRDDVQAAETAMEFAPLLDGQRLAVVHDRTAYAKALADGVAAAFKARGVNVVSSGTIVAGEKDYGALVAQLKAAQINALYFAGFPAEADLIMNGLQSAGVYARFIGSDALAGLKRPRLVVMAPRPLGADDITGLISRMLTQSPQVRTTNPLLERHVFDIHGDELLRSYIASPAPLE